MIDEPTTLFWESPDLTYTNSTSYMKNSELSELKLNQPANQQTPKVKPETMNPTKIQTLHQILHPYLVKAAAGLG